MKSELSLKFDNELHLCFKSFTPRGKWILKLIHYGCQIVGFGGEIAIVVQYVTRQSGYSDAMVSVTEVDGEIYFVKEHPKTDKLIDTINDMIKKMLPHEPVEIPGESKSRPRKKGDSKTSKKAFTITLTEEQITDLHIKPETTEIVIGSIKKQATDQGYIPIRKIASKRLTEIKTDLENLISEANGILEEIDPELHEAVAKRGMGWINTIIASLSPKEMNTFSESMIYMEDTIRALEGSADRGLGLYGRG